MTELERRSFPPHFKKEVVHRVIENHERIVDLVHEYGIHTSVIARWVANQKRYGTPIEPRTAKKKEAARKRQQVKKSPPPHTPEPRQKPSDNQLVMIKISELQHQLDRVTEERDALVVTLKMMMRGDI